MRFSAEYRLSSEGGIYFVQVPAEVKRQFAIKGTPRVIAAIGELEPFHCGLMPMKSGEGLIFINKERQKQLGLTPGDSITVTLSPDESEYGAPMPEELEGLLAQDDDAKRRFDALTPGKKRALMFAVDRVKGMERRIEMAVKLLLKPPSGNTRW